MFRAIHFVYAAIISLAIGSTVTGIAAGQLERISQLLQEVTR